MTAITPIDRPKSVRNSFVFKVFGGVFMLSRCFLDCSVGVGVFVTGLSQISSFFSKYICITTCMNPQYDFLCQTSFVFIPISISHGICKYVINSLSLQMLVFLPDFI